MTTTTTMPDLVLMDAWDPALVAPSSPLAELAHLECQFEDAFTKESTSENVEFLENTLTRINEMRTSLGIEPYQCQVNVVGGASGAGAGPGPLPLSEDEEEDELMDKLRSMRATLQQKQDEIHRHGNTDKEIARAEKVNDELVRKIRCIEDTLLAFGSFYRTR